MAACCRGHLQTGLAHHPPLEKGTGPLGQPGTVGRPCPELGLGGGGGCQGQARCWEREQSLPGFWLPQVKPAEDAQGRAAGLGLLARTDWGRAG